MEYLWQTYRSLRKHLTGVELAPKPNLTTNQLQLMLQERATQAGITLMEPVTWQRQMIGRVDQLQAVFAENVSAETIVASMPGLPVLEVAGPSTSYGLFNTDTVDKQRMHISNYEMVYLNSPSVKGHPILIADCKKLPYADNSVAAVLMSKLAYSKPYTQVAKAELDINYKEGFLEAQRVLAPGGVFVFQGERSPYAASQHALELGFVPIAYGIQGNDINYFNFLKL